MTAGALTDVQLPARQLQTCARLMQGWVESAGSPPNKNPGYAGAEKAVKEILAQQRCPSKSDKEVQP